jgi:hypothetical protein
MEPIPADSKKRKRVQFEETHIERSIPAVWGAIKIEEGDESEERAQEDVTPDVFESEDRVCVTKTNDGVTPDAAATAMMLEILQRSKKINVEQVKKVVADTSATEMIDAVCKRLESLIDRLETTQQIAILPTTNLYGPKMMPALQFLHRVVAGMQAEVFADSVWADIKL